MMRRFLAWAAVLSFALPSVASAQVVVGIGAGLRSASLSIEDNDDDDLPDSRTGIGISGFVSIPVNESFSIQPGIGFVQKGAEETEGSETFSLELDYLEVPVLGVFHLPSEGAATVHLFAGPVISFEMSCGVTGEDEGVSLEFDCEDDDEINTKSTEFGAIAGAAVSYSLNDTASLFLAAFYNLGLTNINDDTGEGDDAAKNRVLGINLGVAFTVGG